MSRADAFPHTRRPLPWILAAFLVMIFFVPVDQTDVRIHLPFDSKFDRFAIVGMVFAWMVLGRGERTFWRSPRSKLYAAAAALFVAVALTGDFASSARLINLNQWSLAQKQLTVLITLVIASWFAMSALRPEDLRGIASLIIGLGVVMSIGVIIESRAGYNVFYSVSAIVLKPIAIVAKSPTNLDGEVVAVAGPTSHGLAVSTMLAMVMPFAMVRMFEQRSWSKAWLMNGLFVALMIAAGLATQKKTALLSFVAVIVFLGIRRPRALVRLAPLAVVLIGFVHFAAPGSLGSVIDPARWTLSETHRSGDLSAIMPDVEAHPLLGRGYGSMDPVAFEDQFRVTDDQILGVLWESGALGLLAYLWMIISPIVVSRRACRSRDPDLRQVALAASAGCVAYLVANVSFDALGFVQAPYTFFVVAALCTVASGAPGMGPLPSPWSGQDVRPDVPPLTPSAQGEAPVRGKVGLLEPVGATPSGPV